MKVRPGNGAFGKSRARGSWLRQTRAAAIKRLARALQLQKALGIDLDPDLQRELDAFMRERDVQ